MSRKNKKEITPKIGQIQIAPQDTAKSVPTNNSANIPPTLNHATCKDPSVPDITSYTIFVMSVSAGIQCIFFARRLLF